MKKFLPGLLVIFLLSSCSTDDYASAKDLGVHDISFSVSSTDPSRLSHIEFEIMNSENEVSYSSYGDGHLPLIKDFINRRITEFTILEISYIDNSGGAVGATFEPYTVTLQINVDSKMKAEKEFTVTESDHADFVGYQFNL